MTQPTQPTEPAFRPCRILYENHRGVVRWRRVQPVAFRDGVSEWHKTPGALMDCIDLETGEPRVFALSGVFAWRDGDAAIPSPVPPEVREARLAGFDGEPCPACSERKTVSSGNQWACDGCGARGQRP